MNNRHPALVATAALLLAIPAAWANTTFASISGDPNNSYVPNQLSTVNQAAQTVTNLATLGDGSLGFNGGLTYGSGGLLFAIANDFSGAGSFYSIQPDGTLNLIGSAGGLGYGFLGGLAYDPFNATFYAAVLDDQDNTTLASIDAGGAATVLPQSLGTDFTGLTFDIQNGLFYGVGNDDTGFSTLYSFSLGGSPTAVAALGYGFGALTYDDSNNVLWAIDPVNNFSSQLYQITPSGTESGPLFTLGDGFVELAAPTPEPAPAAEMLAGLLGGIWLLRKRIKDKSMKTHFSRFLRSGQLFTAGVFLLAATSAHAQFSTPMRDIDNPGRAPFQLFSQFNTQPPNGNSYTTLTSVPAAATQRLVLDYVNIEINNLSGPVQTQGFVTIEVRTTATPTFPVFQMILPVTIMNNTTFGGNAVAVVNQPIHMYVSAGQTLTITALNLSGSSNMNIGAAVTGHYVSLP